MSHLNKEDLPHNIITQLVSSIKKNYLPKQTIKNRLNMQNPNRLNQNKRKFILGYHN